MAKFNVKHEKHEPKGEKTESAVSTIYGRAIAPERAPSSGVVEIFNMDGGREVYVDGRLQAKLPAARSVAEHLFSKAFARDCLSFSGVRADDAVFAVVDWARFQEAKARDAKPGRAPQPDSGEYRDFHRKVGVLGGIGEGHARLLGVGLEAAEMGIERNFEMAD